jgi:hypothetical protein
MRYGDERRLESDRRQWIVATFMHVMRSLKSSAAGRFSASESVSVFSTIHQSYKCECRADS